MLSVVGFPGPRSNFKGFFIFKNMPYILLSLKWTRKTDQFLTFWGPNDAGYFMSRRSVGVYESIKPGYHESGETVPIDVDLADQIFNIKKREKFANNEWIEYAENSRQNWELLGLEMKKGKLIRKVPA